MLGSEIKLYRSIGAGSCGYTEPSAISGGALFFANNGLSLSTVAVNTAVLGQNLGQAGNPGRLLSAREIPMNGFQLLVNGIGNTITGIPTFKADAAKAITTPFFLFQDSAGVELLRINSFATGANNNTMFGAFAGNTIAAGAIRNTLIGYEAGKVLTTGTRNTFVGWDAGPALTTGSGNVFIGHAAGQVVTTGSNNTAIGSTAMQGIATTSNNTAVGNGALNVNTGSNNTAIGFNAYAESIVASNGAVQNTVIGASTAQQKTWGNNNFIAGFKAGFATSGGANNIIISPNGLIAGEAMVDNNIILGANMSMVLATSIASNTILIGTGITATGAGDGFGNGSIFIGQGSNITGGGIIANSTVIGQGITCNISNVAILGRADQNIILGTTASPVDNGAKLQIQGDVTTSGAAPLTAGAGKRRFGKVVAGASVLNAGAFLEEVVDGVLVKICIN